MDFNGVNNRYGQVAVPDFLEYLCTQSPKLAEVIQLKLFTQIQCSKCRWISQDTAMDVSLRLYIPGNLTQISLPDLVDFNSKVTLQKCDAVYCGKCKDKCTHFSHREGDPDSFFIEVIRVTESKRSWRKNNICINFPISNLKLPGFPRSYRVVASCHHRGSLFGGHWFTKMSTKLGWYELDDLRSENILSTPPGLRDNTAVVLLLLAEDRLVS